MTLGKPGVSEDQNLRPAATPWLRSLSLARAGIPHRVLGSLGYERAEGKDALAYLTMLVNPADAPAFRRATQSPKPGAGPATAPPSSRARVRS